MSATKKPTGGQAFFCDTHNGVTLRDYFAGEALKGLLSNPGTKEIGPWVDEPRPMLVAEAYAYADAMLEARGK